MRKLWIAPFQSCYVISRHPNTFPFQTLSRLTLILQIKEHPTVQTYILLLLPPGVVITTQFLSNIHFQFYFFPYLLFFFFFLIFVSSSVSILKFRRPSGSILSHVWQEFSFSYRPKFHELQHVNLYSEENNIQADFFFFFVFIGFSCPILDLRLLLFFCSLIDFNTW
jgi:hypothetical protein